MLGYMLIGRQLLPAFNEIVNFGDRMSIALCFMRNRYILLKPALRGPI